MLRCLALVVVGVLACETARAQLIFGPAPSSPWTDASATITNVAAVPTGLAATSSRYGFHLWNIGTSTVCFSYSTTAAAAGSGCAVGSVPVVAGAAYFEDYPANVSPEAISLVCTVASCPVTIKVR